MPRYPCTFISGYAHHIVQRGHNRQPVFAAVHDYRYYLANLKEQKGALNIRVFAYCLMTNHVYLILQPDDDPRSVSRLMRVLAARQTRYANKVERHCQLIAFGSRKS